MKLKNLTIQLQPTWADNAGKYTCEIEYDDKSGSVKMLLDEQVSEALLVCIGETITQFAAAAAKKIEINSLASVAEAKQIKSPAIEQPAATETPVTPESNENSQPAN